MGYWMWGHPVVGYACRTGLVAFATAVMMPADAASDRRVGEVGVLLLEGGRRRFAIRVLRIRFRDLAAGADCWRTPTCRSAFCHALV